VTLVTCAIDVCGVPTSSLHIQTQLEGLRLFRLICTLKQAFPSCNAIRFFTCAIDVCGVPTSSLQIQTQLEGLRLFGLICILKQAFPSCNAIGKTLNKHMIFIADSTKEMFASFFPNCPFVRLQSLTP
jgi:hypothetical protein